MSKIKICVSVETSDVAKMSALRAFLLAIEPAGTLKEEPKEEPKKAPISKELYSDGKDFEEKKAPKKRATKKVEPKKVVEEVLEKEEDFEEEPKPTETESIKIEDVRALLAVKVADNRDAIKAKLSELKAKNVTTLKPEHYQSFSDFLNKL